MVVIEGVWRARQCFDVGGTRGDLSWDCRGLVGSDDRGPAGSGPVGDFREIARNGGRSDYRAHRAAERADQMARRPKPGKLEANRRLHDAVAAGLVADWSPEQIAGRLRVDYPR